MTMSNEEIIRSYTQSKDQRKQIGILADLNGCDKEKIRSILIHHGVKLPTPGRPKKEIKEAQEKIEKKREAAVVKKAPEAVPETKKEVKPTVPTKPTLPMSVETALEKRIEEIDVEIFELNFEKEEIKRFLEGSNE